MGASPRFAEWTYPIDLIGQGLALDCKMALGCQTHPLDTRTLIGSSLFRSRALLVVLQRSCGLRSHPAFLAPLVPTLRQWPNSKPRS
jgi:hypothetical protein